MDERESVPRREAIVGLSLLGLFSLLLTGTLAYRIVNPTQREPLKVVLYEPRSLGALVNGSSESPAPAAEAQEEMRFPAAEPIPTVAGDAGSIPATALDDLKQPRQRSDRGVSTATETPPDAPRFVAPANR